MKETMMEDEITDFKVRDSLGNDVGEITDVIVDTTVEPWPIRELMIGTGIRETKTVEFTEIALINEDDRIMELHDGAKLEDFSKASISRARIPLDQIKDREVTCENDVELGDIYHFVVSTGMPRWEVRKLLIRPKGEAVRGRRIRLDVLDVLEVKDTVRVRSSIRDVKDRCLEVK